jgi:hypothetical protein
MDNIFDVVFSSGREEGLVYLVVIVVVQRFWRIHLHAQVTDSDFKRTKILANSSSRTGDRLRLQGCVCQMIELKAARRQQTAGQQANKD